MRCKRCGSIDIVLFKDIHRCNVCDSTNIIDETAEDIKQGDGLENKQYLNLMPKLWNPNAVANWCLVFTPIFGSFLISKNWKELNQAQKAKGSMVWFYVSIVILLIIVILAGIMPMFRVLALAYLVVWYLACAKRQVHYIKRNQINYEKKDWGKALLFGAAGYVVLFVLNFILFFALTYANVVKLPKSIIEESSAPVVTQLIQTQLNLESSCNSVTITDEISSGVYNAIANLDDGTQINLIINVKGNNLYINVPPQ